jgi:hypothetical protein
LLISCCGFAVGADLVYVVSGMRLLIYGIGGLARVLACRARGHDWLQWRVVIDYPDDVGARLWERSCRRCGEKSGATWFGRITPAGMAELDQIERRGYE